VEVCIPVPHCRFRCLLVTQRCYNKPCTFFPLGFTVCLLILVSRELAIPLRKAVESKRYIPFFHFNARLVTNCDFCRNAQEDEDEEEEEEDEDEK
jgi:hypothetical protein